MATFISQTCRRSAQRGCGELAQGGRDCASKKSARFIWLWPPVELLHEEGIIDRFVGAFASSFLSRRRLEEFPRRCEANGRENQRAFTIRSKSRRRIE